MARKGRTAQAMLDKKAPQQRDYSDDEIIAALVATRGMVTLAASKLGCADSTIYRRIKASEAVANAIQHERERTLDFAEVKLIDQINKGNVTALIFYLKTQGKARGYIERSEVVNIPAEVQQALNEADIKLNDFWSYVLNDLKQIKAEQSIKSEKAAVLQ